MDVRWEVLYSVVTLVALIGAVLAAIAIFIVVMLALLFIGGPGLADACDDRPIDRDPATLVHFDDRWENFNVRIDARGRSTSVSFDESDLTARARDFLRAEDVQEIRDVTICLSGDEIEATGKLAIAILPDINVRLTGAIDFSGEHPVVTITDVDAGSLPGFLTSAMEDAVADGVNDALDAVNLVGREFLLTTNDGVATIEFLPATAHDPPAPQTIQLKEGGQFLHWHSPATPVATVFHDVTIVWRWDGRAWSHSYIPGISPSFDLEADDFLWVVSPRAQTIPLEPAPDSVLTAAPCTGDDYDRDAWGSDLPPIVVPVVKLVRSPGRASWDVPGVAAFPGRGGGSRGHGGGGSGCPPAASPR